MKSIVCLIGAILVFYVSRADDRVSGPRVEERVELMSVIARTAGFDEYCSDRGGAYTRDIDAWFRGCTDYPVIRMMKDLRKNGLGYDGVMEMAVRLEKEDGKFVLPDEAAAGLDERWDGVDFDLFVSHLNSFYTDSRFEAFFEQHEGFYGQVIAFFNRNVMVYFDEDWYGRFYREKPREKFSVVIGFTNGSASYGPCRVTEDGKEVFAIVGYMERNGKPVFYKEGYVALLVHEFNHSFVNHLLDENGNSEAMESPGTRLFRFVSSQMSTQAYGDWQTFINESIVRAATICYMKDNGYSLEDVKNSLLSDVRRGFLWTPSLVTLFRKYERNPKRYGSFSDFYPHIIRFLDKQADRACRSFMSALE